MIDSEAKLIASPAPAADPARHRGTPARRRLARLRPVTTVTPGRGHSGLHAATGDSDHNHDDDGNFKLNLKATRALAARAQSR